MKGTLLDVLGFILLLGATHAEGASARLHPQPNLQIFVLSQFQLSSLAARPNLHVLPLNP